MRWCSMTGRRLRLRMQREHSLGEWSKQPSFSSSFRFWLDVGRGDEPQDCVMLH
jgi:hypothetical protein